MMSGVDEAIGFAARKLGLEFKSQQVYALRQFAQGNDIFINLPTGFGKSLIFQASPVVVDLLKGVGDDHIDGDKSLVIVVLPLKALAVDQLDRVCKLGLEAADITSGIPDHVLEQSRKYSVFIFASPESLCSSKGKELLLLVKTGAVDCLLTKVIAYRNGVIHQGRVLYFGSAMAS